MKLFLKSLSISIGLLCLGYIPLNAQNFNSGAVVFDADLSGRLWHISSQKSGYPLVSVLNGNAVVRQGQALDNYRTFIIEDGPNDGDGWTADVRWFHIRNRIDGKYLTVQGNDAGSPLGWETYVESTGEELWKQQFRLIATDQFGWYKLRSRLSQSGPDLNIEVDATGRLRVESAGDPFASEQKFAFNLAIPDHQGTQFVMVGKHNNDFISDRGYSQNGATAVHVAGFDYSCLWTFLDAGDGYHYVQNAFTGNYLSDEDSGIITMSTTQGENEKWELKPYDHTFALVSKAHNHYVGTNGLLNNGTPVFGVSAVGQGIKWVLSPVADLDPELLSGDYQQILEGAAALNPCIDFGLNFQKGICERVGLPADAYYFPSVQEALKEYYGTDDLATQALQNFEFGNEGHRAELAYAFRNYILGNLARKLPGTRTALETAVVTHFETRVQQLRYQYASALSAKWGEFETAFGFNDNSNLPMSQLLDNLEAGDFDWPEMYAPDSEQQVLLNNYTSACKTFNLTNNSTAFGMKINLATQPLVWPGGAILMNLAAREIGGLAVNLIPQGLTDAAIRATQVITRQILAMCSNVGSATTVGMIAYQILVQEILDAREVTELEARVMDRIIWGNTPVFMFGIMNGTHELEKTQLMMDLDHEIGAPTSVGFQINNNDNVTKTPFSLVCNSSATIELDANGSANLIPIQLALGIIPECGGDVEFNMSQSQFDCSDLGTRNVFLEAHNTALSRSCTVPVTILDHNAPVVNCNNPTIYLNASGTAALTYPDVYQGGTDNCGVVTPQSLTQNFFGCSHLGTNTVTLTANDGHGNTASCQSFVTVVDNLAPAVSCKNKTVYLDVNGAGSIETGDVFQSGVDNCGVVNQVSVSPNVFDCSKIGSNSATLTVNDGHGNTNTCVSTITVADAIAPSVACKNFSVNLNAAGTTSITTSDVFQSGADNCGVLNQQSVTPSSFDCSKLGSNTVTLTVNDSHGNTNTCTSTVTVSDPIVPTLLCKNATISLNAAGQATLNVSQVNNGSYDNCAIVNYSLSQSVFSCANLGNNTVALSGIDASNNKSVCTATVTVLDAIVPLAKCKNATANLGANGSVAVTPSAVDNASTDNCSFNLTVTPNSFTCGNVGLNTVTLRATDASGNSSSCTAQVNVKDISAPTAVCKNATVNLNSQGLGTLSVAQVDNGSADNCGLSTMSLSKTHFNCSELGASPWTISLTVKDVNNNTSSCSASVTVKDITAPTAVCANTTVSLGSNGTVTVFPADLAADSYDNCSVWSYLPAAKVYTSANLGNNNLNITVKDWSGNGAVCTSVVKVLPFGNLKGSDGRDEDFQSTDGLDATVILFPNPSNGEVTMTFRLPAAQKFAIRAYDTSGRLIYSHEDMGIVGENTLPIQLTGIAPGLYLLDFQSESLKSQKRMVIQE